MSKVLVTGVNGFVGHHLAKQLADNNYEVVGIGGAVGHTKPSNIESYLELDLTKTEEVRKVNFNGIDSVIHLAGLAAVGPSFDDPMLYMNVNAGIEINLFERALRQKLFPRFLVVSSGTLYDAASPLPLTEESPVAPNSPYAVSKLAQEQMAIYYQGRGFEVIIARPFNHIGPGQGPGFIVPDLAQQIVEIEKGTRDNVLVGNLDAERDYTDVRDIVKAYRLLLEKGQSGQIYNICSGKAVSGHSILEGLMAAAGSNTEIKQDAAKMRPSDTPSIYGSYEKLNRDTGWQPEVSLEATLKDVITDWRSRI